MTVQDIIKQTKTFTPEEKQELLYLLFVSTISEDKRKDFANLLHYEYDAENTKNIGKILDKYTGTVENVWNEDAQVYINKLREDDRQF